MSYQDENNNHVDPVDKAQAGALVDQIDVLLAPYMRNLSEEQNVKLGVINEQNKLFVNKVRGFHLSQPALDSPEVDWAEFEKDFESREFYELLAQRLESLAKRITETRRTHDYDNYQCALIDYRYAQYKNSVGPGAGYDSKIEELSQFFTGGGSSSTDDTP